MAAVAKRCIGVPVAGPVFSRAWRTFPYVYVYIYMYVCVHVLHARMLMIVLQNERDNTRPGPHRGLDGQEKKEEEKSA